MSSERRAQAFNYFVSMGWTREQAAGLVANIEAESGLRPDAVGDGGLAYGLCQWHPDRQTRFAAIIGRDIHGSSFQDQLAFVHAELQAQEKSAGDALRACTTAEEAGACVSLKYERPADREGEASRRAKLAAQILAGEPQTTPPISIPQPTPEPPVRPDLGQIRTPETVMPLLAALLPSVLSLFAPRAQAALQKVTGGDAKTAAAFTEDLFAKIAEVTGQADPVQAVAALKTAATQAPEQVRAVEDHALDALDRLAPVFERLAKIDRDVWQAQLEGRNAAAQRALIDPYDVAPMMVKNVTVTSNWLLGGLIAATIVAVVCKALFPNLPDYVPMLLPVLGLLAGQISKERGAIIAYRFDGTPASNSANAINAELAKLNAGGK